MKNYLTPLAILVGAILISITTYVALTKPQKDLLNKRMETCIEEFLRSFGNKTIIEASEITLDDGTRADQFIKQQCRYRVYK
jgi:hypothetical protein